MEGEWTRQLEVGPSNRLRESPDEDEALACDTTGPNQRSSLPGLAGIC